METSAPVKLKNVPTGHGKVVPGAAVPARNIGRMGILEHCEIQLFKERSKEEKLRTGRTEVSRGTVLCRRV